MTKWVVGFVTVAIVSFILGDLFGDKATSIFGGRDNTIGEIAGDRITIEEFQNTVQELETNYQQSMGRTPSEQENGRYSRTGLDTFDLPPRHHAPV
ncbi:MAG: SurA N-terminal domain-containing protein [Bacteroidota bacterium]